MLMIKTSTKITNSLPQEMVSTGETSNELGEDELAFYGSIKKDLAKLEVTPKDSLIDKILKHSRSL